MARRLLTARRAQDSQSGWHLDAQMPAEQVTTALERALALRQSAPGLIVYVDCGSQYTSVTCRICIAKVHLSCDRVGNPYDNTQDEPAGAPSKPSCYPPARPSPIWKKPDSK